VGLPPELDRLGDRLVAAARRTSERRERRRRFAVAGVIGALAFAALTPASLEPAHRFAATAATSEKFAPRGCDHEGGVQLAMAACEGAMVLHRPYAIQ
jgi:hypothetical protein